MRDILFRGKQVDNGEWVFGDFGRSVEYYDNGGVEHLFREGEIQLSYIAPLSEMAILVIPSTVGQYTGLKDKNGKEICEGDIVRHSLFKQDYKFLVKYFEESASFRYCSGATQFTFDSVHCKYFEIIGNIHDNPELLEVKD